MAYYDDIYEHAADQYGLFTSTDAKRLGIPLVELGKLSKRGRLNRLGYGVYRIPHYVPTPLDQYADAVALVGHDAYIYGESVLAMLNLAPTNPSFITVASPRQIRKKLPPYYVVIRKRGGEPVLHEGIPSQSVADAIRSCRTTMMSERLIAAVAEARRQGLLTEKEASALQKEIEHGDENPQ